MPGTAAMLDWALERAAPCVLMSETNARDSVSAWWKREIKRRFVVQCGAALVGGAWHRDYLIQLGMEPASIFDGYDVVDNCHFHAGAEAARLDPARSRVLLGLPHDYFLACARFEPKKNLRRLIEGYAIYAREAGPSAWSLAIAGDGPSRAEFEILARDLGVAQGVVFGGLRGYEDLPAIYGLARAFVHASTTEQWGLVVNEAMAAGLPVLVSQRCGCSPELVDPGRNGFTFDPYDTEELSRLMLRLTGMSETQRAAMGQASTEIISRWAPETFAANLIKAVEVALAAPRPKAAVLDKALLWAMVYRPGAMR
jgi:glycosyltransferase involved in cell wall biosynthesis